MMILQRYNYATRNETNREYVMEMQGGKALKRLKSTIVKHA